VAGFQKCAIIIMAREDSLGTLVPFKRNSKIIIAKIGLLGQTWDLKSEKSNIQFDVGRQ